MHRWADAVYDLGLPRCIPGITGLHTSIVRLLSTAAGVMSSMSGCLRRNGLGREHDAPDCLSMLPFWVHLTVQSEQHSAAWPWPFLRCQHVCSPQPAPALRWRSVRQENVDIVKQRWVDGGRQQFPDWKELFKGIDS